MMDSLQFDKARRGPDTLKAGFSKAFLDRESLRGYRMRLQDMRHDN